MLLHSCQDLEPLAEFESLPDDENCLEHLSTQYSVGDVKGVGGFGIVLVIVPKNNEQKEGFVIKIMEKIPESKNEIIVGCKLNNQGGFVKMYGWLLCGSPPDNWIKAINEYRVLASNISYFYVISELGNTALNRMYIETPTMLISIVFEVLYALWQAREQHQFVHNDLYKRNIIMFDTRDVRMYTVNGETYRSRLMSQPKITDFGQSSFSADPNDDVKAFLFDVCTSEWELYAQPVQDYIETTLYPFLATILRQKTPLAKVLTMPIFDVLKTTDESDSKRAKLLNCQICNRPAKLRHSDNGMLFCGHKCFDRLGIIGTLI